MFDRGLLTTILILTALLGAAVAWAWLALRRTNYTLPQAILYLINTLVTRLLWRTTVSGPLPVAAGQGAVIVCNHRSGIDPLLIQLATDRVVHWMVASEYWHFRLLAFVFHTLGSIPVSRRGVDTAATKQAIRLAKAGGLVGLFPEGRINVSDELLLPGRPGAALIAIKARVPVIPCYIRGAPYNGSALGPFRMRARAHVTFGQPIDLEPYFEQGTSKPVLAELTLRFLKEIATLSGDEAFEPQLAGKRWRHGDDEEIAGDNSDAEAPDAELADDSTS